MRSTSAVQVQYKCSTQQPLPEQRAFTNISMLLVWQLHPPAPEHTEADSACSLYGSRTICMLCGRLESQGSVARCAHVTVTWRQLEVGMMLGSD
jgi:hypothetical protein